MAPSVIAQCPDPEDSEELLQEGRDLDDELVTQANAIIAEIDPTYLSIQKLCSRGEADCIPPEDASVYYESRSCEVSSPPCLDQASLEAVRTLQIGRVSLDSTFLCWRSILSGYHALLNALADCTQR